MRPSVSTPSTSQVRRRTARARVMASVAHRRATSDDARAEEIVQVQRADQAPVFVDDQELRDLRRGVSIVSTQSMARSSARTVRGVRASSRRRPRVDAMSRTRSTQRRRSPSVKMPATRRSSCTTTVMPMPLRLISTIASTSDAATGVTGSASPVRMTSAHAHEPLAERAGGVRAQEVLRGEAARVEQRQRERVAQRERGGGARGRRESERTGFGVDARVEMDVGGLRERALLVAGDRDERGARALDVRQERHELVGLAGIGEHEHDVVGRDHAEVAVHRLGGVHEERRRAGRRERGRELAPDVSRLADAADDDAAAAVAAGARPRRRTRRPGATTSAAIACASIASTWRASVERPGGVDASAPPRARLRRKPCCSWEKYNRRRRPGPRRVSYDAPGDRATPVYAHDNDRILECRTRFCSS